MHATAQPPGKKPSTKHVHSHDFDPEGYRMTFGEHLEDLRWRMVLGLSGFAVAVVICMIYSDHVMVAFAAPLIRVLQKKGINPQMYYTELSGPFMTYLKVSLIGAAALAGPWMLFQIWQFVAAGLYPRERKYITKYVPLSITLLIVGMVFVYFVVLPLTVLFFIEYSSSLKLPLADTTVPTVETDRQPLVLVPKLGGNPAHPVESQMWYDTVQSRLKMFIDGKVKVLQFGPENLMSPIITLSDYIDLVISMMLIFGLAFQLPLVIVAVVRVGIVEVAWLRKMRRYVYFVLSIVSAVIAPGDVVTTMMSLFIPMIVLYEFGIILAAWGEKHAKAGEDAAA